jgi:hypothetical protein
MPVHTLPVAPDSILYVLPKPATLRVVGGEVRWALRQVRLRAFDGSQRSVAVFETDGHELVAVGRGGQRRPRYDPIVNATEARRALDELAALSRTRGRLPATLAGDLATAWGVPLSLCGVCRMRHVRDQAGWHAEESIGREPIADWIAWAEVVNALRRSVLRVQAGDLVTDEDLAGVWGPRPWVPPRYAGEAPTRKPWDAVHRDPMTLRQRVYRAINEWLVGTCVAPAIGRGDEDPDEAPARSVVRIGSRLALVGWALRQDLTTDEGEVRICEGGDGDAPGCGITWHVERRRVDTEGRKRRRLCPACFAVVDNKASRKRKQGTSPETSEVD